MRYLLLIFLCVTGCAYPKKTNYHEPEKADAGQAVIYLYRAPAHIHSLNPDVPRFYLGDKLLGKLIIGGYYVEKVQPGEVEMYLKDSLFGIPMPWRSGSTLKFNTEAGKSYYVKFAVEGLMGMKVFQVVPESLGKKEIFETKLLQN